MSDSSRRHARRQAPSALAAFLATFVLAFVAMGAWSFATPLGAAPDEAVHVMKAAAVVRGEFVGHLLGGTTDPLGRVSVPAFYTHIASRCYARHATRPASCAPLPSGGDAAVTHSIYNARYPPLYYAIVGLPTLLGASTAELYLMRLLSALLSALFVAIAVASAVAWSRTRFVIVGIVVAATPMVLFLGGVVNPVGFETSAAIAVWTTGAILVLEHLTDPPPGLLAVLGVSACVLELLRALSPFWLALTALVLLALAGPSRVWHLFGYRRVRVWLGVVVAIGALAVSWIVLERSYDVYSLSGVPYSVPESTILENSFFHNDYYLPGMIGVFGWFDTYAPTFTYVIWYGLIGFVTIAAAVVGRMRDALTLLVFALAIVIVPVAISTSQVHRYGYTWNGKDTLPFAVGLPIVAAELIAFALSSRQRRRAAAVVAVLAFSAQVAAFFETLRRYAVGTHGPDFGFLLHPRWRPPAGLTAVLVVEVLALAGLGVCACVLVGRERREQVVAAGEPLAVSSS